MTIYNRVSIFIDKETREGLTKLEKDMDEGSYDDLLKALIRRYYDGREYADIYK